MYNKTRNKREVLKFRRFSRKGYSLFACLGREVLIGTLSVATLAHAKADGMSTEPLRQDTLTLTTERVVGAPHEEPVPGEATAERELTLDEVSVMGSRAPLTIGQAARMVSVLDSEAIASAPARSVNDLLKLAAGVDVRQKGALGALTDVSIRGGTSDQIAVLINGINICDAQTGHNTMDLPVDISEIERIEVVEGPAGRVYGSSSLYGAINIVTRPKEETSLSARAEGGSYGYASAGARANYVQKGRGSWRNQLSGSYTRSDGFSRNEAGSLNGDYKTGKAFYQGAYDDQDVRAAWHAGLSVKDFGSNTFYGTGSDDQFEHTLKTFMALQAENKRGRLHLKPSIYWNHQEDRFEYFRGDDGASHGVPFNYHRADVFGVGLGSYFDWLLGRTALSAELRNEDLISTTLGEELQTPKRVKGTDRYYAYGLNRTNVSFVLEHNVLLNRLTLSAGLVAVKNSWNNRSMKAYPGVDISYRLGENLKLFASYNTSLRMPSATELYYSVGGHKADKYLKPEELTAVEGGIKYLLPGLTAKSSVYYNHCRNIIDWIYDTDEGDDAVWQSVNFTKVNTLGIELSLKLDFRRLKGEKHPRRGSSPEEPAPPLNWLKSISLSYNYLDQDKDMPANLQSKYTLEYLRHKLVADVEMQVANRISLGLSYRYQDRTGTYTDTNGDVKAYRAYGIVDGRLAWQVDIYKIYVDVNNLLGQTYVDYGNVAQPGTWVIAGVSIDLTSR